MTITEKVRSHQDVNQSSAWKQRFQEIAAKYSWTSDSAWEQLRGIKYNDPWLCKPPSFPPSVKEDEAVATLLRPDLRTRMKIKLCAKPDQSKIAKQQMFIAATNLVRDTVILIWDEDRMARRVDCILRLGGSWDDVYDSQILQQQETERISIAACAIRTNKNMLLSLFATSLLQPHHLTTLLDLYFEQCTPDQVRFLVDKGADPTILSEDINLGPLPPLVLFTLVSPPPLLKCRECSNMSSSDLTSSPKEETVCTLCKLFQPDLKDLKPHEVFRSLQNAIKSANVIVYLKILYCSQVLWDPGLMTILMLDMLDNNMLSPEDKSNIIEATISMRLSQSPWLWSEELSGSKPISKNTSRERQLVQFVNQRMLNLDAIFNKCCKKMVLPAIKMLQKYSVEPSLEIMKLAILDENMLLWDTLFPDGWLPHSLMDVLPAIASAEQRGAALEKLFTRGMRCIRLVDEIWYAIAHDQVETASVVIRCIHDGQPSCLFADASAKQSDEFLGLECSCTYCPRPIMAAKLGWCDDAIPPTWNVAITSLLRGEVEWLVSKDRFPKKPGQLPRNFVQPFSFFMREGLEFDENIETCLRLARQNDMLDLVSEILTHCRNVPKETLCCFSIPAVSKSEGGESSCSGNNSTLCG